MTIQTLAAVPALEIEQLSKTYRNNVTAVSGVDLQVKEGDFFALLGPNGAGKSTMIGMLCALINKTGGRIRIFGHDLDTEMEVAKALIGIVPQEVNFSQFETCLEIVLNQGGYYGVKRSLAMHRAKKYLVQLGLWEKRHECSRNLSGGMKRRLLIARALVHEPHMLILDEPTAGVDVELRRSMWRFLAEINQAGTTIVLTTHYLEEAENLCKNIAIIDHGKIIEDTSMKQLLAKLNQETFILDLVEPAHSLPDTNGFLISQIDETTLEIEITRDQSLNELFDVLTRHRINVYSMRNKSNRLEELFLKLLRQ